MTTTKPPSPQRSRAWPTRRPACRAHCAGRHPRAPPASVPSGRAQPAAWVAPLSRLMRCSSGSAAIARAMAARDTGGGRRRRRHRPHRRLEAVDAAQAAAGAAGQGAPPLLQRRHALGGDVELDLDAAADRLDLDVVDLRRLVDDVLGQREAAGEILEIAGRGHHHGMADAVIDQRHRDFLGDDLVARLGAGRRQPPRRPMDRAARFRTAAGHPTWRASASPTRRRRRRSGRRCLRR